MSGMVIKGISSVSEEDLEQINRYTRRRMEAGEVYTFSVALCDNEVDRDLERFSIPALEKLKELFLGKTGIFDHAPKSENQAARIFATSLEIDTERKTMAGEPYTRLVAKAYLPRSEKQEPLILEIDSGIKKEVSIGCSVSRRECSVCGAQRGRQSCKHQKGQTYSVHGKEQVCHDVLSEPSDAYEWSFVAVPAQREAGVIKSFFQKKEPCTVEQILKEMGQSDSEFVLSKDGVRQLLDYLAQLDELAQQGREYRAEITRQVLKLSRIIQPEISSDVMKRVTSAMSLADLQAFEEAFTEKAGAMLPIKPQLTGDGMETGKTKPHNQEFQI